MNKVLNKMERKIGRFAVPNFMRYIVMGMGIFYILAFVFPGTIELMGQKTSYVSILELDWEAVLNGQVWRLFSFIFSPPMSSPLFIIFTLFFYYFIGNSVESQWGAFRFNLYYVLGMLLTIGGAMISGYATSAFLNYSLYLAFAMLFPEHEIRMFFVLPIKMKYLGVAVFALFIYTFFIGTLTDRTSIAAALLTLFIFCGEDLILKWKVRIKTSATRRNFKKNMKK